MDFSGVTLRLRATLEAMGTQHKLILEPPIATADEHARLVEADQRFQAALDVAIATWAERIDAVEATVQLKQRRTKLPGTLLERESLRQRRQK